MRLRSEKITHGETHEDATYEPISEQFHHKYVIENDDCIHFLLDMHSVNDTTSSKVRFKPITSHTQKLPL